MNWRSEGIYVPIVPETLFRELSSEKDASFATILFSVPTHLPEQILDGVYTLKKDNEEV